MTYISYYHIFINLKILFTHKYIFTIIKISYYIIILLPNGKYYDMLTILYLRNNQHTLQKLNMITTYYRKYVTRNYVQSFHLIYNYSSLLPSFSYDCENETKLAILPMNPNNETMTIRRFFNFICSSVNTCFSSPIS